jgi:putative hydrolase of HD superfamily
VENKIKNVLEFYELTSKLKTTIRSGWKDWNVSAPRLESVAEHVFSSSMLAIAIDSEFNYGVDIKKVVYMLALHELEEIIIGDITPFQGVSKEDKRAKGKAAVEQILSKLCKRKEIGAIVKEYEECETREAKFAMCVDKLDAGLQCKIYDEKGHIDPEKSPMIRKHNLKARGYNKLADSWLEYCIESYGFDKTFTEITRGARKNENWANLGKARFCAMPDLTGAKQND